MVTKQYHFYLNPGKITDDFIINELKEEKNLSRLVKGLLYVYYKEIKPYGERKIDESLKEEINKVI